MHTDSPETAYLNLLRNEQDINLWSAFKSGNRNAFAELFKKYYTALFQYGIKLCPDSQAVEDCIQELFIELWQSKTSQPVQSVKAYLFKATRYKVFKWLAGNKAREKNSKIPAGDMTFEISPETFLIEQQDDDQKRQRILAAINSLPDRQKEIIYLKIFKNLSYDDVNEIMDINYQVARNLFSQSIKSLRTILSE